MTEFVSSSERVGLRPLAPGDFVDVQELVRDDAVAAFLGAGRNAADLEDRLLEEIERFKRTGWGLLAVVSPESQRFLGYVGFVPFSANDYEGPELVCAIHREFRSLGVGIDACRQATAWGFATHDWPRIYACVAQANTRVMGLIQRLGMHFICERPSLFDGVQMVFCVQHPEAAP